MGFVTSILDALRRFGSPTEKSAIARQDEQLRGKGVIERRQHMARSEHGQTSMFVATIEPQAETLTALSDQELEPILENAELAGAFIDTFLVQRPRGWFIDDLDEAFGEWSEAGDKRGYSSEAVIEILGAAFGRFCSDTLDMRWVRVSDADGSAIAVQGRKIDFRGYPYHAISKRIPLGEYGFFKPIYISLQDAARSEWKPVGSESQTVTDGAS